MSLSCLKSDGPTDTTAVCVCGVCACVVWEMDVSMGGVGKDIVQKSVSSVTQCGLKQTMNKNKKVTYLSQATAEVA